MSRYEKLKARLLSKPADFSCNELATFLRALGYREKRTGSGSRVAFIHKEGQHIIRLHRPHPTKILKRYQLDQIIEDLERREEI